MDQFNFPYLLVESHMQLSETFMNVFTDIPSFKAGFPLIVYRLDLYDLN